MENKKTEQVPKALNRSMENDAAKADLQSLDDDSLENVSGGMVADGSDHECDYYPTGNEKDGSSWIFFKAHYIEVKCRICGNTNWRKTD